MNKSDLIEEIVSKTGFTKKDAELLVNESFDLIVEHLLKGEEVKITDFGTFSLKVRQERNGTNPKTGEHIKIAGATSIGFKPSKKIKAKLN